MFDSFVLCPKFVWISQADDPNFWKLTHMHNSRFDQKAELLEACCLQIRGTFDTAILEKDSTYSVLYFFNYNEPVTGLETSTEVSLTQKDGQTISKRQVNLNPGSSDLIKQEGEEWLALEAGKFQPSGVSREITFNLLDTSCQWKRGLVFAGVEIRVVEEEE